MGVDVGQTLARYILLINGIWIGTAKADCETV